MKDEKKRTNDDDIQDKENDNLDQLDKIIEEKNDEADKNKIDIDPEILDRIVSELEEKYNLKKENIKIVKVEKQPVKKRLLRALLNLLLFWVFDFLLIIALNGYLGIPESDVLNILIFSIVFYLIEFAGKTILDKYYKKLILYSFGTVILPVTIISLMLAQVAIGIEFLNNDDMIIFFILFIIVRIILRFILMRKEIMTVMKGRRK